MAAPCTLGKKSHLRFLTLRGQILLTEAAPETLRQLLETANATGPRESTIYSVPPMASCLRCSKFTSIQMTRHQMVGGYLLKLWLNLGALPHGEGATRMEVAAGWRINR